MRESPHAIQHMLGWMGFACFIYQPICLSIGVHDMTMTEWGARRVTCIASTANTWGAFIQSFLYMCLRLVTIPCTAVCEVDGWELCSMHPVFIKLTFSIDFANRSEKLIRRSTTDSYSIVSSMHPSPSIAPSALPWLLNRCRSIFGLHIHLAALLGLALLVNIITKVCLGHSAQ